VKVALIGGEVGYQILRALWPRGAEEDRNGDDSDATTSLTVLLGPAALESFAGKTVLDFGCGTGSHCVEIARRGATRVIGLDIRESVLQRAREAAARASLSDRCRFVTAWDDPCDFVLSMNAFEHFGDPAAALAEMRRLVRTSGRILIAFGPPWLHPLGGHLFSVFPWSHLIFTESALCRWRRDFKDDGAQRFHEVDGGLNKMTVRRFERLVERTGFQIDALEAIPIRPLRWAANRVTREFTTSFVRCALRVSA